MKLNVEQTKVNLDERLIRFDSDSFGIPEQMLLDHASGKLLFVAGAGVSYGSDLPDFKRLTSQVYEALDQSLFSWISEYEDRPDKSSPPDYSNLNVKEEVEARRYVAGEFDVGLGMFERRLDTSGQSGSQVRNTVAQILLGNQPKPNSVHKSLLRLSDRGAGTAIVTTNFDRLFQQAAGNLKIKLPSYSLGSIPRPDRRSSFSGIFHIHGLLDANSRAPSDLVLTEQDFGEYYLRRRIAPDFLYDALRLFDLVFVGYSLNDPPMQYLMNAVAADADRFPDLGKRYVILGRENISTHEREDWSSRGFIPVFYDSRSNHRKLGYTLERWSEYSAVNGSVKLLEKRIKKITREQRSNALDSDIDLFDHFYRRSTSAFRANFPGYLKNTAIDWHIAMNSIEREEGSY